MIRYLAIVIALASCSKKAPDKAVAPDKADHAEPADHGNAGVGAAEAQLALHRLEKAAKQYYVENAGFPKGRVGETPSAACCPKACPPALELWNDPTWKQLGFVVSDPSHFQYAYDSDGATFTATAVGGSDCGAPMTLSLLGKAEQGNVTVTLTGP